MRPVLFIVASLLLPIGLVGIPIPGIPGTPLVLLAGLCFAYSSPRTDRWLRQRMRKYGKVRDDWEANGCICIRRRTKIVALSTMWLSISLTALYATSSAPLRVCLLIIAAGVTVYLATRPEPPPQF